MNDLNEILIFSRVAQLGSFSAAARSLRVPVSMVSRKVADLEQRLGILLIKRTTRKLTLTEEGAFLYDNSALQLQEIVEAEASLGRKSKSRPAGNLKITAPFTFGHGLFQEFIAYFVKKYPEIQIDQNITNLMVDLVVSNVDIAIRYGEVSSQHLQTRRLGVAQLEFAASPEYLRKKGIPQELEDLSNHDCLLFTAKETERAWEVTDGVSTSRIIGKKKASANNYETLCHMAERGLGIAFLPESYVRVGIKNHSLKRVLPRWSSPSTSINAVHLNRRLLPRKVEVFLEEISNWETKLWRK